MTFYASKKIKKIVAVFSAVLLLGSGCSEPHPASESRGEVSFSLPHMVTSETVTLDDFVGQPVVLNSWATWCAFCKKELVDFAILQEEYPEVPIIAINRGETKQTALAYTDAKGITNSIIYLLDSDDSFYKSIAAFTMPETLFLDAQHNVVLHKRGVMTLEQMRAQLNKMQPN